MRLSEFRFAGRKLPVVEMKMVACSIKQRWAGRCDYLTLPFSLMGSHCVLTFKFPQYLPPCLFRCFPSSCYLSVRAMDLTADLKHCSATSVLFNAFPLSYLPFLTKPVFICYVFQPPHYLSILRSPIYLPLSLLMRVKDGA